MKPGAFTYRRAHSVEEALSLLAEFGGDAKIIAGGQSLVPLMAFRLARPSALVDVNPINELSFLHRDAEALRIGALTRHRVIETTTDPGVLDGFSLLRLTAPLIGHYPIRTRGTFGGSIAHADPTAEWCMLALLLDAQIVAHGPSGARDIPAGEFFVSHFTTALAPDEMLTEVRFPRPFRHVAVREFARRQGDFAVAAAAVALDLTDGIIRDARIALGGVGATPLRALEAEVMLTGQSPNETLFADAARSAAAGIDPPSDVHGSGGYRRHLADALVRRALADAAAT